MVNLLLTLIISGFAATFALEFVSLLLNLFIEKDAIYKVLSLPASFGALYCFNNVNKLFFVTVPATAFIVLIINKWLNAPAVLNYTRRNMPRL